MKKSLIVIAGIIMSISMVGCESKNPSKMGTGESTTEMTTGSAEEPGPYKSVKADKFPQLEEVKKGDTIATFNTSMGIIKVRLFPEAAPKAVENFTTHAKAGYYDGVIFHRVIEDFMIQSGDPQGTGRGGESIWGGSFDNEVSYGYRNFRGALSMANAGGNNTNGSQFFIVQNNKVDDTVMGQLQEFVNKKDEVYFENGKEKVLYGDAYPKVVIDEYAKNGGFPTGDMSYTVFGQVYEGMDVVDEIAKVQTNADDKPLEDVIINNIEVGIYGE